MFLALLLTTCALFAAGFKAGRPARTQNLNYYTFLLLILATKYFGSPKIQFQAVDAVSWMRCCTHHVGVFRVGLLFQLGATSPAAVAGAGVAPGSHSRSVPVRAAVVLREKQPHGGGGGYLLRRVRLPNPRAVWGNILPRK